MVEAISISVGRILHSVPMRINESRSTLVTVT